MCKTWTMMIAPSKQQPGLGSIHICTLVVYLRKSMCASLFLAGKSKTSEATICSILTELTVFWEARLSISMLSLRAAQQEGKTSCTCLVVYTRYVGSLS